MKVLVCGGRDYEDMPAMYRCLNDFSSAREITTIIHGCARGADSLAHGWAKLYLVETMQFPALWKQHGKAAGSMRNQQMLDEGKPDLVLAFPGGVGTADMIERAKKAGVPVVLCP